MQPQLQIFDPQVGQMEDARQRRAAWCEAISPFFTLHPDRDVPVPKSVGFRCYHLDRMLLSVATASPATIERTQTQIATQGIDHVVLRLYLTPGSSLISAKGDAEPIAAGTFALFDLSQRMSSTSTGMRSVQLCMPRRLFHSRVGEVSALHNGLFRTQSSPLLQLLNAHVQNTRECLESADHAQRTLLTSATIDLVNAALTPVTDSAHNHQAVAAIAIRQFVEENLHRSELGIEMISARFGLSRTPIYKLFEPDGGVLTYIRNRRLARGMRMLAGIEGDPSRRVSSVAYACGYESAKMFSKAFHKRYGVNPRDVDGSFRVQAHHERSALMLSWMRDLV